MFRSHDDAIVTPWVSLLDHSIGSILHEELVHNEELYPVLAVAFTQLCVGVSFDVVGSINVLST